MDRKPHLSVDNAVLWRRDVRRFKTTAVDDELLLEILTLADHAPSVGNSQPWRIVLIETAKHRAAMRRSHEQANLEAATAYSGEQHQQYLKLKLAGFDTAPVHLAVFCDAATEQGHGLGRETMPEMLRYSCVSMISTMWLVARARGVGMGWVSILRPEDVVAGLGVPQHWQLIGYLLLGWPETEHCDPELERFGWQHRTRINDRIMRV